MIVLLCTYSWVNTLMIFIILVIQKVKSQVLEGDGSVDHGIMTAVQAVHDGNNEQLVNALKVINSTISDMSVT